MNVPVVSTPTDFESSATAHIATAIGRAIAQHRLAPGAKLVEQKLADQFGVSRTLVRQALFQLAQKRLVVLQPARGAFVAAPSLDEAHQVFAVRRLLEPAMVRAFVAQVTPAQITALRRHVASERASVQRGDVSRRTELLADFHVRMAELMGNAVLAELLGDLLSRSALIALMYQSPGAAQQSSDEHAAIVDALAARDAELAVRLMDEHLAHVLGSVTPPAP